MELRLVKLAPPDPDQDKHNPPMTPFDLWHERSPQRHPCPYQAEFHDNPGPHCHCCPDCVAECQRTTEP